jgi:hypothetical protein
MSRPRIAGEAVAEFRKLPKASQKPVDSTSCLPYWHRQACPQLSKSKPREPAYCYTARSLKRLCHCSSIDLKSGSWRRDNLDSIRTPLLESGQSVATTTTVRISRSSGGGVVEGRGVGCFWEPARRFLAGYGCGIWAKPRFAQRLDTDKALFHLASQSRQMLNM